MSQTAILTSTVPPMTPAEEDAVILSRLLNDERIVRRVARRFNTLVTCESTAKQPEKEALIADLALLHSQINTRMLMCDAETRQVLEYESERLRIEQDQERLRGEIVQLKAVFEEEQIYRKRKLEYDAIAEKINLFPTRSELNESIGTLEEEIAGIEAELEAENSAMAARRDAFDNVVSQLQTLRLMGKEPEETAEEGPDEAGEERARSNSPVDDDGPRGGKRPAADAMAVDEGTPAAAGETSRPGTPSRDRTAANSLNPFARAFKPGKLANMSAAGTRESSVLSASQEEGEMASSGDGDIEMGEVSEAGVARLPGSTEEREEGEASPTSPLSDLT